MPNDIMLNDDSDLFDLSADMQSKSMAVCTVIADDFNSQAKLYNTINAPKYRLVDFVGKCIEVTDIFVELVRIKDKNGVEGDRPRIVLIDKKGEGYGCVSWGVYRALKKLMATFGTPTWPEGIPLTIKQINKDDKRILTLMVGKE